MTLLEEFETYLKEKVEYGHSSRIKDAMAYSLLVGGKRIRPQLLFATLQAYDMDPHLGFPCACAIEMIHTYSLIHDDLPAMDDDDLRRGKPSCHKAFDEASAILAGDALLTRAFDVALETQVHSDTLVKLIHLLSDYSGVYGMVYGQELDLAAETKKDITLEEVYAIDEYKTAKLLTLPFLCAAYIAGKEDDSYHWEKIGYNLGIQFQIQDDILDQTQSSEDLGKTTSDLENNKQTFVSLLGLEAAKNEVLRFEKEIESEICFFNGDVSYLKQLIKFMIHRTY